MSAIALAVPANYTVQAGDSLWKISNQFGVSIDQIKKLNGLQSDSLQIGQKLILSSIANQTPAPAPAPAPAVNAPAASGTDVYVVKSGDTLWAIARQFGTSIANIKEINGLTTDALKIGQTLKINASAAVVAVPVSRSGDSASAARLLEDAAQYLGTPYKYGGSGPGGFDCSGFTSFLYARAGYSLPRTAAGQYSVGAAVAQSELQPGDLLFFAGGGKGIDHVGIYAGNGQMIHSSSPRSGGVIYTPLSSSYYAKSYVGARRVLR
ncbi:MAG TPA: LysM peptidoglycan-binding domain-containing protein [Syntrophomonas sp.]|nr:LysM peptidoglycan-binding domain-containing protein [Syntrophomonas sp.]